VSIYQADDCTARHRPIAFVTFAALAAMAALLIGAYWLLFPNEAQVDAEQYAVYSAYIQAGLTGESHDLGSAKGPVIILGRTAGVRSPMVSTHVRSAIPQLSRLVAIDFAIANRRQKKLEPRFSLTATYQLATKQEVDAYGSEQFERRFAGNYGYLTFSRIGFNRDLTEAFFYTEHICGLCGEGKYVFMRRVNGRWLVEATSSTWVS
jgi:hypothetical protein